MRGNGPPAVARLPGSPGVYRFRDAGSRVLYVGRASVLRGRVASYWSDLDQLLETQTKPLETNERTERK